MPILEECLQRNTKNSHIDQPVIDVGVQIMLCYMGAA